MSTQASISNKDVFEAAFKAVRSDTDPTNWLIVKHENEDPNSVEIEATGANGLSELKSFIKSDQVQYALLRITSKFDLSTTVKFVYIYNLGEKVGFAKKGRFGIVKGDISKHFQPYHVDVEITTPEELNEEDIKFRVESAAGSANHVRDANFIDGKQERGYTQFMASKSSIDSTTRKVVDSKLDVSATPKVMKPVYNNVATQSQGLVFAQDLLDAIKEVRDDKSQTSWAIGTYQNGSITQPIVLLSKGTESAEQIKSFLKPDIVAYGLHRVTDYIDNHPTIKFVFIAFIGESVQIMSKAKISTHKGAVNEKFAPFHVDLTISDVSEISDAIIQAKVSGTSGSRK